MKNKKYPWAQVSILIIVILCFLILFLIPNGGPDDPLPTPRHTETISWTVTPTETPATGTPLPTATEKTTQDVPTATPTPAATLEPTVTPTPTLTTLCEHTVVTGDTISYIVLNCEGVESPGDLRDLWARVCLQNGIENCNRIYIGQLILVFPNPE